MGVGTAMAPLSRMLGLASLGFHFAGTCLGAVIDIHYEDGGWETGLQQPLLYEEDLGYTFGTYSELFTKKPANLTKTSPKALEKAVKESFLARAPKGVVKARELRDNVTAYRVKKDHTQWGVYIAANIETPKVETCKVVMSDIQDLAEGVSCPPSGACDATWSHALTYSYGSELGMKYGASATGKASIGVVDVEMSVSWELNYAFTWSRAQSDTLSYTFHMGAGEACVPSIMHLDLECEATPGTFMWDTLWAYSYQGIHLERYLNRGGGPYADGQWCEEVRMKDNFEQLEPAKHDWAPIFEQDWHRGHFYRRRTSELNELVDLEVPFTDDELAIRRQFGDGGENNEIFRCKRAPPEKNAKTKRIIIPLASPTGRLQGFVGCV